MNWIVDEPFRSAGQLGIAAAAGMAIHPLGSRIARRLARHTQTEWDSLFLDAVLAPARIGLPLLGMQIVLPFTRWAGGDQTLDRAMELGWIFAATWFLLRLLAQVEGFVAGRLLHAGVDNLRERRTATQVRLLRRILSVTVLFLAVSLGLLSFEQARRLAAGLLTTAGIAGVVLGLSAQKTLGNLLAGIQIAMAQPIRLDDLVVVEGESGRVEEITLTYVVIRIWDHRTLILPISYFLEKPFQNWTRTTAEMLGTVDITTDPEVPVEELRAQLRRFVGAHPLWDGRVCSLQVVEWESNTVKLRAVVSASDSGKCWDLRCEVREALLAFLVKEHPGSLARTRIALQGPKAIG
ncbi:MAG TPA: mechanosensitive ion channel family protein [Fibrobacteria bacterium]|nr:mechanosensitive ion channel family protein [Fibrobacteria bacterium]